MREIGGKWRVVERLAGPPPFRTIPARRARRVLEPRAPHGVGRLGLTGELRSGRGLAPRFRTLGLSDNTLGAAPVLLSASTRIPAPILGSTTPKIACNSPLWLVHALRSIGTVLISRWRRGHWGGIMTFLAAVGPFAQATKRSLASAPSFETFHLIAFRLPPESMLRVVGDRMQFRAARHFL